MRLTVVTALLVLLPAGAPAAILRASAAAPGPAHDGASWATAFTSVQPALNAAKPGDEVWVAAGTYAGDLTLPSGVALYGGFHGDETTREQRMPASGLSVLTGGRITTPPGAAGVVLDGVTVQGGMALTARDASLTVTNCLFAGKGAFQTGGSLTFRNNEVVGGALGLAGVFASNASVTITGNTIRNCTLSGYTYGSNSVTTFNAGALSVTDCHGEIAGNTIQDNHIDAGSSSNAIGGGAGLCAVRGVLVIRGNRITGNTALISGNTAITTGGGIYCENGTFIISDNLIAGNRATAAPGAAFGAGMYIADSSVRLVNNTITGNRAGVTPNGSVSGGGLYLMAHPSAQSRYVVENNIIAFNDTGVDWHGAAPEWAYNDVFGNGQDYPKAGPDLSGKDGNISSDPLFADAAAGDFHLRSYSPLRDAGDDLATEGTYALDGVFRIQGAHVDMGAYEGPAGQGFTMADVARALRVAGGMVQADLPDLRRLRVSSHQASISITDAIHLARKVAGLDANP
jgi:predicted outer membrane repeat protein